jgi:UDP-glucose 4-epimerase
MDAHKTRSVLVTGGRGFVGRAVARLLQREGYGVVSVDQAENHGAVEGRREVVCDITDAAQLRRVFAANEIGGIIHLAAVLPTVGQRQPAQATRVNIEGSLNLFEMTRRSGVRRLVFGSSLSVYGTWAADRAVSETDRAAPEDLYGASKLYVEQLGEAFRACFALEFVSLRIGRVVGPGARSATSAWRSQIFELLNADRSIGIKLPYVGSERVLVVHVDDVAQMLVMLLQVSRPAHMVYNALCESVVVEDLKREVEKLNPKIRVELGQGQVVGNPRLLDASRFQREYDFHAAPIFEQLRRAARA